MATVLDSMVSAGIDDKTVPFTVIVHEPPVGRVPRFMFKFPVPDVGPEAPPEYSTFHEIFDIPMGNVSDMITSVAVSGPLLVAVMV
ncbi:hypothetical protein DSECCO2_516070 [anaerobic digester metagenome]